MAFDKRAFNKQIKTYLTERGFERHTNRRDYFIDCADGETRLVVRVPNGNHGFYIGVQFADHGGLSGNFSDTVARWFAHETVLNGAAVMDYTPEDVDRGLRTITDALAPYMAGGKAEVAAHMNDFYTGNEDHWVAVAKDFSEQILDETLVYFGFPPVDPYSDAYFFHKLEQIRAFPGWTISLPLDEYEAHREFYDRYKVYGLECHIVEDIQRVWIMAGVEPR